MSVTAAGATPATATDDNPADLTPGPAGVVVDMPDEVYHENPALSYSGAKLLLPPNCPAKYRYDRDHIRKSKPAWDLGHVLHKLVLGVGPEIVIIEADSLRTKAAQADQAAAYAAGSVPLLRKDYDVVLEMVASIRAHSLASSLLDPANGTPEVSLFMEDEATGVSLRGRLDLLPHPHGGRMILPDLKSAVSAEPEAFSKSAANYLYHLQAIFYQDLVTGAGLADEVVFVFVVVEKEPPFLVEVIQLDDEYDRIGRALKRQAIDIFADCTANDTWPGYNPDYLGRPQVSTVTPPRWYAHNHSQDIAW